MHLLMYGLFYFYKANGTKMTQINTHYANDIALKSCNIITVSVISAVFYL